MSGFLSPYATKRQIIAEVFLPREVFYREGLEPDLPGIKGRRFYFSVANTQDLKTNKIKWFSGLAKSSIKLPIFDLINYWDTPGGLADNVNGQQLFYNKNEPNPLVIPYNAIQLPDYDKLPVTITLVDVDDQIIIDNVPFAFFLNRLIGVSPLNRRNGYNLELDLEQIDLNKSYITIFGNGLPMIASGVTAVLPQTVYNGVYKLFVLFNIG